MAVPPASRNTAQDPIAVLGADGIWQSIMLQADMGQLISEKVPPGCSANSEAFNQCKGLFIYGVYVPKVSSPIKPWVDLLAVDQCKAPMRISGYFTFYGEEHVTLLSDQGIMMVKIRRQGETSDEVLAVCAAPFEGYGFLFDECVMDAERVLILDQLQPKVLYFAPGIGTTQCHFIFRDLVVPAYTKVTVCARNTAPIESALVKGGVMAMIDANQRMGYYNVPPVVPEGGIP